MRPSDYSNYGLAQELGRIPTHSSAIVAEAIRRLLTNPWGTDLATPPTPEAPALDEWTEEILKRNAPTPEAEPAKTEAAWKCSDRLNQCSTHCGFCATPPTTKAEPAQQVIYWEVTAPIMNGRWMRVDEVAAKEYGSNGWQVRALGIITPAQKQAAPSGEQPKSLLRAPLKPGERLVCYCPPGICQAPKGFSGPCNRAKENDHA